VPQGQGDPPLTVSSLHNDRIKTVRGLQRAKGRRASGRTLLEGPHLLEAALTAGVIPEMVFVGVGDPAPNVAAEVVFVTEPVLDAIAPTESPRGPVAVIEIPDPSPLRTQPTVVLWDVSTPGNVGTLIRAAAALGWNVARHGGADPWNPKALRAAAGAHFGVSMSVVASVKDLETAGLRIVAAVASGGAAPSAVKIDHPIALVIGNESSGLPDDVIEAAAGLLTIPMVATESLNVAVAGSIAMYALRPD
jgi:RNA methyltransferase, TrmH family